MKEYNYKDGLKILKYIGINNLDEHEQFLIMKKWQHTYSHFNGDLLKTIESLYVGILPMYFHSKDFNATTKRRRIEFEKKLKESRLPLESLDKILEKIDL